VYNFRTWAFQEGPPNLAEKMPNLNASRKYHKKTSCSPGLPGRWKTAKQGNSCERARKRKAHVHKSVLTKGFPSIGAAARKVGDVLKRSPEKNVRAFVHDGVSA